MRKTIITIFIMSILLVCCSCRNPTFIKRKPCNQPNTNWESENGLIKFSVNSNGNAVGKFEGNDEIVEFYLVNDTGSGIHVFPINVLEKDIIDTNDQLEYWLCSYKSKRKFIATVKETTYFEVGQKITFYRVDSNNNESN